MENSLARTEIKNLNDTIDNLYNFLMTLIDLDKEQRFSMDCYNELNTRIQEKIIYNKMVIRDIQREFNL
jgi:hypothetical protein